MIRIVLLALVGASLLACKTTPSATMWDTTCSMYTALQEVSGPVCADIPEPKVVFLPIAQGRGGYYKGGDTVYVSNELKGQDKLSTILHEMVHYIDNRVHGIAMPGPSIGVCKSESNAWFIEGVWWGSQGRSDKVRLDWWVSYPHCWPYYADKEFLQLIWNAMTQDIVELTE